MSEGTTDIGLDVHKRSIAVAVWQGGEVLEEQLPNERSAVARFARRWKKKSASFRSAIASPNARGVKRSISYPARGC